jgi:redox-sensitive bicupin YhaK (pirin superfamily)
MHFKLESGSSIVQPIPKEYNVFAYIIKGKGIVERKNNNKIIERGNLVIFDKYGKEVYIKAVEDSKIPLELLLIGGIPIREPIARYGPFVMNTQQEIYEAIEDYRNGQLG